MTEPTREEIEMSHVINRVRNIHENIADDLEAHRRELGYAIGYVMCRHCGRIERQDMEDGLRNGWPKCCGYTMTIDVPLAAVEDENE